jgi:hypothetical protein
VLTIDEVGGVLGLGSVEQAGACPDGVTGRPVTVAGAISTSGLRRRRLNFQLCS